MLLNTRTSAGMTPSTSTPIRRRLVALLCALNAVVLTGREVVAQPWGSATSPPTTARRPVGFSNTPPAARRQGDPRLKSLDSSTRMLVELELRDAPPEEREQWLSMLSSVEPDQIPYLLQARRRAAAGRAGNQTSSFQSSSAGPSGLPQRTAISADSRPPVIRENRTGPATGPQGLVPSSSSSANSIRRTSLSPAADERTGPPETVETIERSVTETTSNPSRPRATAAAGIDPEGEGAAEESPEEPPPASRRGWIPPLRPRWGEAARDEPPQRTSAAVEVKVDPLTQPKSSAFMNVELQRVMTLLRAEIEHAEDQNSPAADREQTRRQVQMRLLHLLAEEPQQALQAIPELPAEEQEFWMHLLWALLNELEAGRKPADTEHWTRTAVLLAKAERRARGQAALHVRQACFCHRINSFGSYEQFQQDEFRPGQPVLVYAELQNFRSELTAASLYRTRLRTVAEILPLKESGEVDAASPAIERREFPVTEDLCRSERRDYFHSYRLDLPQHLSPGRYVLRLSITDELAEKSTVADLAFSIRP